ncbi:MAG: GNAT family N-acetyltransferase, partial [Octadecabacter sp.]|nr:GNAT family N-acetyltransferase [Octadecabacter sp.]
MKPALTAEGLTATHAAAFAGKGWPVSDFGDYLNNPTVLVFGDDSCFSVIRLMPPEAEVLT